MRRVLNSRQHDFVEPIEVYHEVEAGAERHEIGSRDELLRLLHAAERQIGYEDFFIGKRRDALQFTAKCRGSMADQPRRHRAADHGDEDGIGGVFSRAIQGQRRPRKTIFVGAPAGGVYHKAEVRMQRFKIQIPGSVIDGAFRLGRIIGRSD